MLTTLLFPLVFIFGTVIGSFLNVLILRYQSDLSIINSRSECPHCHKQLRWWELVPVVSFTILRGQCARCHQPISVQYPIVELLTGLSALLVLAVVQPLTETGWLQFALLLAIVSCLIVLGVIDLRTYLLPDSYIIILSVLVISLLTIRHSWDWVSLLAGMGIGAGFLGFLWAITRGRGLGLGDVKLLLPLGALLGPLGITVVLFLAFMAGGLLGMVLLLRQRVSMKTAIPFGPFLVIAATIVLLMPTLPQQMLDWLFW